MKKIQIKNKKFKIIPEIKIIQGEMPRKWIDNDLKRGIKPIYKSIIYYLASSMTSNNIFGNNIKDISATAYCDDNDEFDEKVGIEVCSAKMELKNHLKLAKLYNRMHKILIATAITVGAMCAEHTEKAQAIEDDLCRTFGRLKV